MFNNCPNYFLLFLFVNGLLQVHIISNSQFEKVFSSIRIITIEPTFFHER